MCSDTSRREFKINNFIEDYFGRGDCLKFIIWHFLENFICVIISLVAYLMRVIKRKPLTKSLDRREDIICKLFVGGVLAYWIYFGVIPGIQDIPNIIHKNVYTVEGVSQNYSEPTKLKKMSINILDDETQKEVRVTFYCEETIKVGDRLVVQYMPYSKFGVLIERNGETLEKKIE